MLTLFTLISNSYKILSSLPKKMAFQKMIQYIKKKQNSFKILFMGLDNAGKSTILSKLLNLHENVLPTFGYKIYSKIYKGNKLEILDIGGQTSFKEHWSNYFEKADGIVFIIDSTDNRNCSSYLNEIIDLNLPISIFINKIDLNEKYVINKELYKNALLNVFKTSANDIKSLEAGLDWLIEKLKIEDIGIY